MPDSDSGRGDTEAGTMQNAFGSNNTAAKSSSDNSHGRRSRGPMDVSGVSSDTCDSSRGSGTHAGAVLGGCGSVAGAWAQAGSVASPKYC